MAGVNDNLIPAKKGEVRNPNGKPKGTRSLSTIIRQLTENPPDWDKLPLKGKEEMAKKFKNKSAWEAIVYVAMGQALAGDQQAREFLGKRGYGDKLDITSDNKPLPILGAMNVPSDESTAEDSKDEQTGTDSPGRDGGGEDSSDTVVPD